MTTTQPVTTAVVTPDPISHPTWCRSAHTDESPTDPIHFGPGATLDFTSGARATLALSRMDEVTPARGQRRGATGVVLDLAVPTQDAKAWPFLLAADARRLAGLLQDPPLGEAELHIEDGWVLRAGRLGLSAAPIVLDLHSLLMSLPGTDDAPVRAATALTDGDAARLATLLCGFADAADAPVDEVTRR